MTASQASEVASPRRRVLVTGAEGTIGTAVREFLADRYDLRSLTREPAPFPSVVADISDFDASRPRSRNARVPRT